jgi:hypothetical protein
VPRQLQLLLYYSSLVIDGVKAWSLKERFFFSGLVFFIAFAGYRVFFLHAVSQRRTT